MSNSSPLLLVPTTRNVTRLFRTATAEDMATGAAWYAEANSFAHGLAEAYGVTVQVAAGVIAAVSPLQSWGANKALAARILDTRNFLTGYLGTGLRKAERIVAGEDVATVLNGLKITNFYLGILTAGAEGVCIDRHAWSLAVNHRYEGGHIPSLSPKRYAAAVDAYVRAARILSREYGQAITPAQVQSVTWTLWRRKFWSDGAFDGERAEATV